MKSDDMRVHADVDIRLSEGLYCMNIAIITGASSGIGEQYLRQMIRQGPTFGRQPIDEIWAVARRADRMEVLQRELDPIRIRIFQKDLSARESMNDMQAVLTTENPSIRLLIHCAGVGKTGLFETNPSDDIHAMIALNCSALSELTRICLPYMIPAGDLCTFRDGPRIMNVASSAGFLPQPGFAVYAASKAYVIHFSRALQVELRRHNIGVTTVCPGPVDTDFVAIASGKPGAKPKGIKSYFIVKPEGLARFSLRAAENGRGLYVYGFSQKALHVLSKLLPARLFTALVARSL
jgi:short-subunit dehydrogenase